MIAIVSAWKPEIQTLLDQPEFQWKQNDSDFWLGITPNGKKLVSAPLGVGFLEACMNTCGLLTRFPEIKRIIFTGTVGLYSDINSMKINDIVNSSGTLLADGSVTQKMAGFAAPLKKDFLQSGDFGFNDLPHAKVATLLALTLSDKLAENLFQEHQCELEHMELYGIALSCQKFKIPWNALLGITNEVGKNGSKQWSDNHKALEKKTNLYLKEYLKKLL